MRSIIIIIIILNIDINIYLCSNISAIYLVGK